MPSSPVSGETSNELYDGAGHFRRAVTSDNFDDSAGTIRQVDTDWAATGQTLAISSTTGYVSVGTPSSYLPGLNQPWVLGTYKTTHYEPFSDRTYVSLFEFNPEGTLRCTRRLQGTATDPVGKVLDFYREV